MLVTSGCHFGEHNDRDCNSTKKETIKTGKLQGAVLIFKNLPLVLTSSQQLIAPKIRLYSTQIPWLISFSNSTEQKFATVKLFLRCQTKASILYYIIDWAIAIANLPVKA